MAPPGQPRTRVCGARIASVQLQRCEQRERARVLIHGFVFPGVGVMAVIRDLASLGDEGEDFSEAHLHCFFSGLFVRRYGRPGIEFVSGKEGLRPRIAVFDSWYCSLRVEVFLDFVYRLFLNFASAPGLSGGRGEMAMAVASSARLAFLRGAVCACCTQYTRCCPFGPCADAVHGAPGHNRWGVVETPLPVKTQGGTMNCLLNFVSPPCTAVGWFSSVVAKSATRTRCGFGGHGSKQSV